MGGGEGKARKPPPSPPVNAGQSSSHRPSCHLHGCGAFRQERGGSVEVALACSPPEQERQSCTASMIMTGCRYVLIIQ